MRRAAALAAFAAALALPACGLLKPTPEQQFGVYPPSETPEDSDILVVTPPESGQAYFYANAPINDDLINPTVPITVRFSPDPAHGDSTRVELLIRGALPDACYELHDVAQRRSFSVIDVTLRVRRPQGAICATVVRPFRYYLLLDGHFGPGPYSLYVNGTERPFAVRADRG